MTGVQRVILHLQSTSIHRILFAKVEHTYPERSESVEMPLQIDQPGKLCSTCQCAFKQLLDDVDYESISTKELGADWQGRQVKLHESLAALEQSATNRCPTCRLLRQKIAIYLDTSVYEQLLSSSTEIVLSRRRTPTTTGSTTAWSIVDFKLQGAIGANFPGSMTLVNFAESCYDHGSLANPTQACDLYEKNGPLGKDLLQNLKSHEETTFHAARAEADFNWTSQQPLLQVRDWLLDCVGRHSLCKIPQEGSGFLPKRLMSVEAEVDSVRTRLVLSSTLSSDTPYIALSYSWGKDVEHFVTTKANYTDHLNTIEFEKLPKTFRDACRVTRSLGVGYIWIDALCIIQPDEHDSSDWDTESVTMRDVYRNAHLTLSAASASNVHQGLFQPRPAALYPTLPCRIEDLCGKRFTCPHHSPDVFSIRPSAPGWDRNVDSSPISERAWVFQERFLAMRTVHFTQHAIFWECATLSASEYEPSGCSSVSQIHRFRRLVDLHSMNDFDSVWAKVVQDFSNRKLTYAADKLPAISGIAKAFETWHSGTYLAGLWKSTMPQSLAWTTRIYAHSWSDGHVPRTRETDCPSWSWASVQTFVNYTVSRSMLTNSLTWLIDIRDTGTEPAGPDVFGKIASGHLCVRGKVKKFAVDDREAMERSRIGSFELNYLKTSKNVSLYLDEMAHFELIMAGEYRDQPLACLRLCRATWDSEDGQDVTQLYMALKPCRNNGNCQYTRIGVAHESMFARSVAECDDGELMELVIV